MTETILSITGRPGLFRLLSSGRGSLIVETIDSQKKRMPVGARDRVTSLNDISMYTDEDDTPLMDVFQNIANANAGKPVDIKVKTASNKELTDFMATALPNYDRDRVHMSDIKKLIQWYNILVNNGYTDFAEAEEDAEEKAEEKAEESAK